MLQTTQENLFEDFSDKEIQTDLSIQPLLEARIFAYDFLRRIFLEEPRKQFLKNLTEQMLVNAFPFQDEHKLIFEGTLKVEAYLKRQDILAQLEYERLHWDYTRLFIGPYELPAVPWESAYLNKDKLLFQEETRIVRLAYLKYAFLPKQYLHEADDHIGLELDFMYQLSTIAYEKVSRSDYTGFREVLTDQVNFLEQHLTQWVPAFTQSVISHADTEFYQGMAQILKGYLEIDLTALKELLSIEF